MSMNNQTNNEQVNNTSEQVNAPRKKVMSKSIQRDDKYTENWVPIKTIASGMIYNDRGEMITGVKIQPKNIFILDQSSIDNTLIGLMNFYNLIDYEFWLIVLDVPVDITIYQTELQLLYNQNQDPRIRKLISQDMEKGDNFKNNNVVDTEYYILFKSKNVDLVQKRIRTLINGLSGSGLIASQTSNDDLRSIVDNFLNGGRNFESGTVIPL